MDTTRFGVPPRRAWLIASARVTCLLMWLLTPMPGAHAQINVESRLTRQGATFLDSFGLSISLDGNTLAVSAPYAVVNGNQSQGAVYVFTKTTQGWTQTAELTATDGVAGDAFGYSVSLSGNTLAVGAPFKAPNGNSQEGAVYVFTKAAAGWTQTVGLTPHDGAPGYLFGWSVSLSGSTLAVGAPISNYRHSHEGAVYVFTKTKNGWNQTAELTTLDGATGDHLGFAVSLSGSTLAVGAPFKNSEQGAAYVFTQGATGWTQRAELTVTGNWTHIPAFGSSVSLSGATLAVSAPDQAVSGSTDLGAVYIYTQGATSWNQTAELTGAEGEYGSDFGLSISLNGSTLAVGEFYPTTSGPDPDGLGTIYIFTQTAAGWTQTDKRSGVLDDGFGNSVSLSGSMMAVGAPDYYGIRSPGSGAVYAFAPAGDEIRPKDGADIDRFGYSISLSGSTMAVSAPFKTVNGNSSQGAIYLFTRTTKGWTQAAELTAADGAAGDYFGTSISLSGATLAVGCPDKNGQQGVVYLFTKTATGWKQTAELTDAASPYFGWSVSLSGGNLAVGAPVTTVNGNSEQGVVYLFTKTATGWKQTAELTAQDGTAYDNFGYSVSLSGTTLAAGAINKTINGNSGQGAVYVFTKTATGWVQTAELTAPDGAAYDDFGYTISLSGSTLAVAVYNRTVNGNGNQGAAYLFTKTATGWAQTAELTAPDGAFEDEFGSAVSLSGNTLVIGAHGKTVNGNVDQGAVYLFTQATTGWIWVAELTALDGAIGDGFGNAVSLSGTNLAIGGNPGVPVYTLP